MDTLTPRPTTIDDLARFRIPADPRLSPDGTRVAYTLKTTEGDKNRYITHIWVVETTGDAAPRQWTNSPIETGGESQPRWSPDGETLLFASGREEKRGQIWRIGARGGEAERLTDLPQGGIGDMVWSPDGATVAFTFRPQDEAWREAAGEERKKKNLSSPPRLLTRRHWREEGTGFVPSAPYDLHLLDIATRSVRQLTRNEVGRDCGAFCWSPDSREIAFERNTAPAPDLLPNATEIFILPVAEGAEERKVAAPLGPKGNFAWSPDSKYLAYLGHDRASEVWGVTNVHPWVVAVDGSEPARDLAPTWDVHCGNAAIGDTASSGDTTPAWVSDSRSLVIAVSDRAAMNLYRVAIAGDTTPVALTTGDHTVSGFTADSKGENLALLRATPTDAGDIYTLSLAGGDLRRITDTNAAILSEIHLSAPIAFDAPAPGGHTVPCFAVLPPDFAANPGPRPTILYIHGGPHAMYAHALFHEYQALAAAGYVVIYPNPRGSKGYGEAWTGAIRGNWGEPAQTDCLACVDYAIAQGWSDGEKLGVAGGSYGGYLTGWVVGHSDRFKAAVAERGVFNLVSMAGTCDFVWRDHDYFNADTTADPADYLRNSPLTYADAITTPTLIIHSEGDLRCPIEQAEQLFAALVLRGRDVAFLRYGAESNHNLSRGGPPDLRLDRQRQITQYFDRYLKPQESETTHE